jgi:hypothetical protein
MSRVIVFASHTLTKVSILTLDSSSKQYDDDDGHVLKNVGKGMVSPTPVHHPFTNP